MLRTCTPGGTISLHNLLSSGKCFPCKMLFYPFQSEAVPFFGFGILFEPSGLLTMENAPAIYHVVLADDDTDHNVLFERVLHRLYPKILISFIGDGEQLLPFLHLHPVDILFLDLKMPCKSGYQCLQEIRRDPALKTLPVTVYSSSAHLSDIQKSFGLGADFYLVKPFRSEHLKKAVELLLATDWKKDCPLRGHYFINNRFVPFTAKA